VKGRSNDKRTVRLSPLFLTLGFSASAITVFGIINLVGVAALSWARQGIAATVAAILALCAFALADLGAVGLHTLTWRRQTPRHLFLRFGPAKGATLWGLDTGLAFTTYRVTSIVWAAMVLDLLGFLPWWAGLGYALGFSIPLFLLVWAIPWRSELPGGQRGEPGWLTGRLIKSQPLIRAAGSLALFTAALGLLISFPGVSTLLHSVVPW